MNYGETLARRDLAARFEQPSEANGNSAAVMRVSVKDVQVYDFRHSIIEHNLEDDAGVMLNLHNEIDIAKLDPTIAGEIEQAIDSLSAEGGVAAGNLNIQSSNGNSGTTSPEA
jgi:hypothetical protein